MTHRLIWRIRTATALATLSSLALSGCGFLTGSSSQSGGRNAADTCGSRALRLATIRADSDPATIAAKKFAELAAQKTGGKITARVYPNSQIGAINDVFAGMSAGQTADMFYEGISIYPTLDGAKAFTVTSVPFLWDSYDQLLTVLRTDRFQRLVDDAAKSTGVRVIAIEGDAEPRGLSANRPVRTAADMKGLKLRIAEAPMPQAFARALGARPQVVPLADLYLSLRQGVVDAQENGVITMVNQSLDEVQKYYMPTDYIRDARSWYVSDKVWTSLCKSQQDQLTAAAHEAGKLDTSEVAKQMSAATVQLRKKVTVVQPDIASFRTSLNGKFEQFDGKLWPKGLLAEVQQLKQQS
jgi:tripartite ATP-independent transporter DctP family solute receptor